MTVDSTREHCPVVLLPWLLSDLSAPLFPRRKAQNYPLAISTDESGRFGQALRGRTKDATEKLASRAEWTPTTAAAALAP